MERIVLFGAGAEAKKIIDIVDKQKIAFVVDNNKEKWGKQIEGIEIVGPQRLLLEKTKVVYISVTKQYYSEIERQLNELGVESRSASVIAKKYLLTSNSRIRSLKDMYKGKRCFIIGTGPSLTTKDLDTLLDHNEICFASNKIFKIYESTEWRPQLYCVSDYEVFEFYYDTICDLNIPMKFLVDIRGKRDVDPLKMDGENKYIFNIFREFEYNQIEGKQMPVFSEEADKYVVDGGMTVTYSMIQIAYYLGFSELYLLGIDFDYGDMSGNDKNKNDHFCKNYIEPDEKVNYPHIEESLLAYKSARAFSESHNMKIMNATRGGKLEVFERVDFDSLFYRE